LNGAQSTRRAHAGAAGALALWATSEPLNGYCNSHLSQQPSFYPRCPWTCPEVRTKHVPKSGQVLRSFPLVFLRNLSFFYLTGCFYAVSWIHRRSRRFGMEFEYCIVTIHRSGSTLCGSEPWCENMNAHDSHPGEARAKNSFTPMELKRRFHGAGRAGGDTKASVHINPEFRTSLGPCVSPFFIAAVRPKQRRDYLSRWLY